MRRRGFLTSVTGGAGLATISGCLGGSDGNVRPDTDLDSVPTGFTCDDDEFERYPAMYAPSELRWGELGTTSIHADSLAYEHGDTAEITLTAPERGNADKWNFEVYTERGWTEVRVVDEDRPLSNTDEDVAGGHTWHLELTETGIAEASRHTDRVRVCPSLVSGRYRFVYHGVVGDEATGDGSVAVAFDVDGSR